MCVQIGSTAMEKQTYVRPARVPRRTAPNVLSTYILGKRRSHSSSSSSMVTWPLPLRIGIFGDEAIARTGGGSGLGRTRSGYKAPVGRMEDKVPCSGGVYPRSSELRGNGRQRGRAVASSLPPRAASPTSCRRPPSLRVMAGMDPS